MSQVLVNSDAQFGNPWFRFQNQKSLFRFQQKNLYSNSSSFPVVWFWFQFQTKVESFWNRFRFWNQFQIGIVHHWLVLYFLKNRRMYLFSKRALSNPPVFQCAITFEQLFSTQTSWRVPVQWTKRHCNPLEYLKHLAYLVENLWYQYSDIFLFCS